jgi:hypothetical protein
MGLPAGQEIAAKERIEVRGEDAEFDVYVGIDWGHDTHQVCVIDRSGKVLKECPMEHSAAELHKLADWLIEHVGGGQERIAVGIEVPHGVIVETLVERGLVVFSLNPKQLDRFRDRYTAAGAKDDRRDARVLADAVRTDRRAFRRVDLPAADLLTLREDSRLHDELQEQCLQASNRLRDQLLRYYPQLLKVGELDEAWMWELWKMAPTPAHAQRLPVGRVQAVLKRHRIRRISGAAVLEKLQGPAFSVGAGVVEAASRHIEVLLAQLALLHEQLRQCEQRLQQAMARLVRPDSGAAPPHEPSDAQILLSLPGVGNLVGATVLAEVGGPLRQCERSMLRPRCGTAPVTKRSGKSLAVHMRYACNPRLRDACHHWGTTAVQHDARAAAHYHRLRTRGCNHARAVRGVVDRLLDVLLAMVRDRTVYDPARYAAATAQKAA